MSTPAALPVSELARRTTLTLFGPIGAFETNADGSWVFVSPSFLIMLGGLPASSLLGREWINRLHPEDAPRVLAEYRQAREFRRPWVQRLRLIGADSVPVWVSVNAFPMPAHATARGVMFIGLVKDISAEVRAEQIAQESARAFSELADFVSEGILVTRNNRVIAANRAAARINRCAEAEQLIGLPVSSFMMREISLPALGLEDGEELLTGPMRPIGGGDAVLVAVHSRSITYSGAPARIVSFVPVDDPHIRTALEDRNFRRLQSLESLLPLAYHRVSLEGDDFGVIEYANEQFASLIGRTPAELIGHSVLEFTHPEHVAASRAGMTDFAGVEGRQGSLLRRFVRPDGTEVFLVLDISVYRDPVTGHAVSMSLSRPADPQDPDIAGMRIR